MALGLTALMACESGGEGTPTSPTPPTAGTPVVYTPIGASDAAGVGASVPCVPLATSCTSTTAYVGLVQRRLGEGGRSVTFLNLAFPGAVLSPDIERIGDEMGRDIPGNLLTQVAPFVPPATTLSTIFAGGNDVNTIALAYADGRGGADPGGWLGQQVQVFARDYARLVDTVRSRAPSAFVVAINLPNFGALPYVANRPVTERRIVQDVAVRLTREAINPLHGRVVVVDLMCNARSYDPGIYSADGFHPNDAGYAYIADQVMAAIAAGTGTGPAASCGFMSLVG